MSGLFFSGIGGLDLGLERAGMRVIWQAENDPHASAVLARHCPTSQPRDVSAIDWTAVERPDLVAGGFPCQPVSGAGNRKAHQDDRWLWPELFRAVRHLRPAHVLVENVVGLFARGIGTVLGDLATTGTTQSGTASRQRPSVHPTVVYGFSSTLGGLPTPSAVNYGTNRGGGDSKDPRGWSRNAKARPSLNTMARKGEWPDGWQNPNGPTGGQLNPEFVEWLMGFPPGWSDLGASETPSSPRSPRLSGDAS